MNMENKKNWFVNHRYVFYILGATFFSLCMTIGNSLLNMDNFKWIECLNTFFWMYWAGYPLAFFFYENILQHKNSQK